MNIPRFGRRYQTFMLVTVSALIFTIVAPVSATPVTGVGRIDRSLIRLEAGPGTGRTVFGSGQYLTGRSDAAPEAIVLDYVRTHHVDFDLSAAEAEGLYVQRVQVTPDGVGHVVLGQKVDGIRVHNALLVGTVDPTGRLVMVGGRTGHADTSGRAALTAGDAIQVSARRAGEVGATAPSGSATRADGKHTYPNPYATDLVDPEPVSAEKVWFITDDGLRLSWLTDVEAGPRPWFGTVVDAETGACWNATTATPTSGRKARVFTDPASRCGPRQRAVLRRSPASTARG